MSDHHPESRDISYVRVFNAPRELVFRCMTEPERLTHFWGPVGVSTPLENIKIDLRPGGVFETIMVNDSDGSSYSMRAEYIEVIAPERLGWIDRDHGMTTTSLLSDIGNNRTEVKIIQTSVPETLRSSEAQSGFSTSLDRFSDYLATLSLGR